MIKSNTRVILGFALTLAGAALVFAGPASAQTGAYTDPSSNVRASLQREHLYLSHTDAVRKPSAAERRSVAAQKAAPFYASTDGAYTDPSPDVRASLQREHMNLSHPYAVREPSAADRRAVAAQAAGSYASTTPAYPFERDLSIRSQR